MKVKKIKEIIFRTKVLIIVLIILAIVGWGLTAYFAFKKKAPTITCGERLEKLNSYALLLNKSTELARQNKSFEVLEMDVRLLDNGTLLAEWEDVIFGGNQQEDLNNYFDVIIGSLTFFSK
jgi:flagellar basal body-associated protein FliL